MTFETTALKLQFFYNECFGLWKILMYSYFVSIDECTFEIIFSIIISCQQTWYSSH